MKSTFAIFAVSVTLLSGCASIVNGVNQPVSVETRSNGKSLAGAACTLSSNKGTWFVTTPGTVTLHRGFQDLAVECTKDGIAPGNASIASHVKGMAFGNILFGGLIGVAVDSGNGAAFDYPDLISIKMGTQSAPDSNPSVSTTSSPPSTGGTTSPNGSMPVKAEDRSARLKPNPSTAVEATQVPKELKYQVAAEKYAKATGCGTSPTAKYLSSGPAFETYVFACSARESLITRCDYGVCRSLQ